MAEVAFRDPQDGDAEWIAPRVVEIEVVECRAFGHTPAQALRVGAMASPLIWTGTVDGEPAAMFGVTPGSPIDRIGVPWMLGTERARAAGRAFLTLAPGFLARIEGRYPRLHNWVHADNAMSIRWLRRLGFAVEPELRHVGGEPFRRFSKGF